MTGFLHEVVGATDWPRVLSGAPSALAATSFERGFMFGLGVTLVVSWIGLLVFVLRLMRSRRRSREFALRRAREPFQPVATSGIEVDTHLSWKNFVFGACTPRIVINNEEEELRPWGKAFFPVPAGRHTVWVYLHYLWFSECGSAVMTVQVLPAQITRVQYEPPVSALSRGTMRLWP